MCNICRDWDTLEEILSWPGNYLVLTLTIYKLFFIFWEPPSYKYWILKLNCLGVSWFYWVCVLFWNVGFCYSFLHSWKFTICHFASFTHEAEKQDQKVKYINTFFESYKLFWIVSLYSSKGKGTDWSWWVGWPVSKASNHRENLCNWCFKQQLWH